MTPQLHGPSPLIPQTPVPVRESVPLSAPHQGLEPLVSALSQAWRSGEPLTARSVAGDSEPPAGELAQTDVEAASRVQQAVGEALGWWPAGAVPPAWKSGAGSREQGFKHAPLPTPAVRQAVGGEVVDLSDRPWWSSGVEGEIALRLGCEVSPAMVAGMVAGRLEWRCWIDAAAVAIELVDSRWRERGMAPEWLQLADGQWHAGLVLGPWLPWQGLADWDWSAQAAELWVDGVLRTAVQGTHPLGEPAWGVPQWLRHLTRHGANVPAGTVVTTGNWTGATPWAAGELVEVCFPGLGRVAVRR